MTEASNRLRSASVILHRAGLVLDAAPFRHARASMHIPDGYLSPSTCATLYLASAPFWYVALQRAKRALNTRTVPLLALFAAFCFVIMMFNLPLPGGTTGHAVGMGMASIVLGPWVSMLGISIALLMQALFFGDGGITAYGANCFNMAIVGSLAAYAVYRVVARKSALKSTRRLVAAGLAGYCAINLSAFFAAVEFGIQPILFHTAAGVPLYAPYPLHIAIPAMMIGHLSFAGLAELVISAGMVGYLQRADPEMLRSTAPDALATLRLHPAPATRTPIQVSRKLWLVFGLALILTPLGIFAAGSAWGEWTAKDFTDASARKQIAAQSGNQIPPVQAPAGLQRLSALWKAPIPAYAPAFIKSVYFGYFVSAAAGAGSIILATLLLGKFLSRRRQTRSRTFIEKTTESLLRAVRKTLFAEQISQSSGVLQSCDARVKLAGIGVLIVSSIAVRQIPALCALFVFASLLALLSRIPVRLLVTRVSLPVLAFTGVIAAPALLLVPGTPIAHIPLLNWPVTAQGLKNAEFLILRAQTAATFALAFVLTTPWNRLLRALRFFKVPATAVSMAEMTYRYAFLLLKTSQEMIESRQARHVGILPAAEQRHVAAGMAAVLLHKTLELSADVHSAMLARGFRGEVRLLDDLRMKTADWFRLTGFGVIAAAAFWVGR